MDAGWIIFTIIISVIAQLIIFYSIIKSATKSEEQARNSRILIRLFSIYLQKKGFTDDEIKGQIY